LGGWKEEAGSRHEKGKTGRGAREETLEPSLLLSSSLHLALSKKNPRERDEVKGKGKG